MKKCIALVVMCSLMTATLTAFIVNRGEYIITTNNHDVAVLEACFTPGMDCTQRIIEAVGQAENTVLVQAYSFTSKPIAKALVDAKKRGIDVRVILDKSQVNYRYSVFPMLADALIPVFVDSKPAIAHNKLIMIDGKMTITGSFNFTTAAQKRNAENIMIAQNQDITLRYINYWEERLAQSLPYAQYADKRSRADRG